MSHVTLRAMHCDSNILEFQGTKLFPQRKQSTVKALKYNNAQCIKRSFPFNAIMRLVYCKEIESSSF